MRIPHVVPPSQPEVPPQIGERPVALLTLTPGEGDAEDKVEIVAARDEFEVAASATGTIDEDRIVIEAKQPGGKRVFLFEGRRAEDGAVLGSILYASGIGQTARLIPTGQKTFFQVPIFEPLPEMRELIKLAESPVPDEDTRLFVEKYPTSPLAQIAWKKLLEIETRKGTSVDRIAELFDEYCDQQASITERLGRKTRADTLLMLIQAGYDPDWCLSRIDGVQAEVEQDEELQQYVPRLEMAALQCRYRQALNFFDSEKDEDKEQGRLKTLELLKDIPYEPMLTVALADLARDKGEIDRAIELYAELVALPLQERILRQTFSQSPVQKILPTERLTQLWKDKHGSTDGLDEYIQKAYDEKLLSFVSETFEERPADSGTHTALLELFTGTRSPAAVTAEVALAGLQATYPQSMVVALRYHMHVPEHDPLTNEDSEARFFNYYRAQTTPSLYLDGIDVRGVAGSFSSSEARYNDIRDMLVSRYSLESEAVIKLTANRQDDAVTISASVEGADLTNERLRLRIALAENDVAFQGFNGIRSHSMVVRKLVGGDRGIAVVDGQLKHQETVTLSELRDSLHDYLTSYEQNTSVEFASMPMELTNLSVVAFIQDDETREVLQTTVVPVTSGVAASE
ncbi:MAG: hypothetical protein ACYTGL_16130 [Planctomycetota bacterium]